MLRQNILVLLMSLLLIGTGFVLGQYYTVNSDVSCEKISTLFIPQEAEQDAGSVQGFSEFTNLAADALRTDSGSLNAGLQVPDEIAHLKLNRLVEGEEALRESFRFLGENSPVKNVLIPYYIGGKSQVIVWAIETFTSGEAANMLECMDGRLQTSDLFYNHKTLVMGDHTVYSNEGFNMHNYFYSKGNMVFWVSVISDQPDYLMEEIFLHF